MEGQVNLRVLLHQRHRNQCDAWVDRTIQQSSPQFLSAYLGREIDVDQYLKSINNAYLKILGLQTVKVTPEIEAELREQATTNANLSTEYDTSEIESIPKYKILSKMFDWNRNNPCKVKNEFWRNFSGSCVEVNTHAVGPHRSASKNTWITMRTEDWPGGFFGPEPLHLELRRSANLGDGELQIFTSADAHDVAEEPDEPRNDTK